jgi:hypothetical protein
MLVLVMSSFVAHADTITYYVNDGVLSTDGTTNSGTFSGSFTFDLQNGNEPNEPGYISAEQFTVSLADGTSYLFTTAGMVADGINSSNAAYTAAKDSDQQDEFYFALAYAVYPPPFNRPFPDPLLCTSGDCVRNVETFLVVGDPTTYYAIGGTTSTTPLVVTPPSATPEPSGLVLLGTGMMGLCGVVRSRLRRERSTGIRLRAG